MALDFPSSVSTGTTFVGQNGITYLYDGRKWTATGNPTLTLDRIITDTASAILDTDDILQVTGGVEVNSDSKNIQFLSFNTTTTGFSSISIEETGTLRMSAGNDTGFSRLLLNSNGATVHSHFFPANNLTYDLGSPSQQWRRLYVGTSTIYLGGNALSVAGGNLTLNGSPIAGGGGNGYTGSQGNVGYTGSQGNIGYAGSRGALGYTGSKGDTGYAGSQGDIGYAGSRGSLGYTGSRGDTGYDGSKGDIGYAGSKGDLGYTGSRGVDGYVGSQGDIGFTGSQGTNGLQGNRGYTGSEGPQGNPGLQGETGAQGISIVLVGSTDTVTTSTVGLGTAGQGWINTTDGDVYFWNTLTTNWENIGPIVGPQGDLGYTGSKGDQGDIGLTGDPGYTGSQGANGYDGSQGETGYVGSQGELGYTGSQGDLGYVGSQGETGYTGSQGELGYTGSQGDVGYVGSQGETGYSGSQGELGYTGSQGDLGYTGSQGNLGYAGSKGDLGYTGSVGPVGPQGLQGEPGGNADTGNFVFTDDEMSVSDNGNITLVTNANTWTFGSNGNLTLPASSPIIWSTSETSFINFNGAGPVGPGGDLVLGTNGPTNVVIAVDDSSAETLKSWVFGTDGLLTLPGGNTRIGNVFGTDAIVGNTGTSVGVLVQGQGGAGGVQWVDNPDNIGSSGTQIAAVVVNSPLASSTGTVQIVTGVSTTSTVGSNTWEFGADGVLTAPGHLLPNANLAYDLGSTTTQWRSIYVGTGTIYIGGIALGVNQDNYVTVDGNPIITVNTAGNLTIQGDVSIGTVQISDTAPTASTGTQWYNTLDGRTYIAYNGTWIDASPAVVPTPETYLDEITIDGSTLNINGGTLTIDDTGTLLVNGSEVSSSGYGATLTASDTDPGTSTGTLWFNTIEGRTYLKYNNQWVDVNPTVVPLPETYLDEITIDGSTINMNGSTLYINTAGVLLVNGTEVTGSSTHIEYTDGQSQYTSTVDLGYNFEVDTQYAHLNINGNGDWEIGSNNFDTKIFSTDDPGNDPTVIVVRAGNDDWTFGPLGLFTLPGGSEISEGMGAIRIEPSGASSSTQALLIYPTAVDGNHIHLTAGGGETDLYLGSDIQYVKVDHSGSIVIGAVGANTSTWTFGTNGVLTLSTASTILGNSSDPNVYIETSTTATTSTWTFGTNGVLTLPAATPVIKGGGTGTDVTIVAANTNTTSTWVFAADGGVTFPDATVQRTAYLTGQQTVHINTASTTTSIDLTELTGSIVMLYPEAGYTASGETHYVNLPFDTNSIALGTRITVLNYHPGNAIVSGWDGPGYTMSQFETIDLVYTFDPGYPGNIWWVTSSFSW